jgi:hypothetical protein
VFKAKHQNQPEAHMNNDTKRSLFPSLIDEVLKHQGHCVDNVFANVWKGLNFSRLVQRSGFKKRSGVPVIDSVFLLLLWKWIDVTSIAVFAKQSLKVFSNAKKDVMYELLKREDVDWRGLNTNVAKTIYSQQNISSSRIKAYVLDDSVKARRGKKMEGVSCHFDHTEGRHVMGQQVLTLGLVTEELFMPLDSQIYMSNSKAQGLNREFKDKRSIVAKRFDEAVVQSKPEIAKGMLARVKRQGIKADYLIADAWFGTKPMMETAQTLAVTGIFRMKKNKMKYRVAGKRSKTEEIDANALYRKAVKGEWKKVRGMPYRAVAMDVELDIASGNNKEPNNKETKQHLGFLKEQTWTFASHTASIHLTAIRYLILVYAKHGDDELRICDVRSRMKEQLTTLDFAQRLWQLFRALISGAIDRFKKELGKMTETIRAAIDDRIDEFFAQALQLDVFTLKMEFKP